jgi:hypothetical protein
MMVDTSKNVRSRRMGVKSPQEKDNSFEEGELKTRVALPSDCPRY